MVPLIRKAFNENFSAAQYEAYLEDLHQVHPGDIVFRVAETPVFIDKSFKQKVLQACEDIVDVIVAPGFLEKSEAAIPDEQRVPNDDRYPEVIAFDFGICENEDGTLSPQLIEMQGFPSLLCYQILQSEKLEKHFDIPANYSSYLGGLDKDSYIGLLKRVILDGNPEENTILLEIYPEEQKTRIDFSCTKDYLGIETVCLTKLVADGKKLFYPKDGRMVEVKRIYNRLIFDDLDKQDLPEGTIDIKQDWDISWCPHPNWFYRISKHTLPFITSEFVPPTFFLNELSVVPEDLENYVLKPLYSFAGQGVVIDVTPEDIKGIPDPENWILQRKVKYAEIIKTPDVPAKVEIRIFYLWEKNASRPQPAQNLSRLSKGKMIGVRYNADKEWVGGSNVFFEQD